MAYIVHFDWIVHNDAIHLFYLFVYVTLVCQVPISGFIRVCRCALSLFFLRNALTILNSKKII